jgi:DNA-binding MarR family transcriptional regulator
MLEEVAITAHQLAMALRIAYLTLHRQTNVALARSLITADQFVVLTALAEERAITQRELVERTSSDPNTLRAMLVLLEERSLIERPPHPTDGRARSVALTPAGRKMQQKLWRQSNSLRRRMLAEFTDDEADTLGQFLDRFRDCLTKERPTRVNPRPGPRVQAVQ